MPASESTPTHGVAITHPPDPFKRRIANVCRPSRVARSLKSKWSDPEEGAMTKTATITICCLAGLMMITSRAAGQDWDLGEYRRISSLIFGLTGALRPAAAKALESAIARSDFDPSGSPKEKRFPSICFTTPGSMTSAAG